MSRVADVVDWELLPRDLVEEIFLKLNYREDWLMLMYVCRKWRDMIINNKHKFPSLSCRRVPVLLVPNLEKSKKNDTWSVYSVADNKLLQSDLLLPPYERPFAGSSEGWIGTINKRLEVIFYKPFDQKITMLRLPRLKLEMGRANYRQWWIRKFCTFTPNPVMHPNDFICVAIFGPSAQLAYIRPSKDNKWCLASAISGFADVVHHNGQFYAVTCNGTLVSFHVTDTFEVRTEIVSRDAPAHNVHDEDDDYENDDDAVGLYKNYLAESKDGELLHIRRLINWNSGCARNHTTMKFRVSKLSYDGEITKWVLVQSLGQCTLFLGENSSILISGESYYKKNCIYFTHDKNTVPPAYRGPWDLGVYSLETKTVTRRFGIDETTFAKMGEGRASIFTLLA